MAETQPEQMTKLKVPIEVTENLNPKVVDEIIGYLQDQYENEYEEIGKSSVKIKKHGNSRWARTARIDVEYVKDGDDVCRSFFLKVVYGPVGKDMVESEYKCLRDIDELANSVGNITPIPVACGEYIEDVYFLVCTFLDMEIKLPPPEVFAPLVAKLHRNSSQTEKDCENPGKKFGKHSGFMTFHGNVRVNHKFSDTWEGYFKNSTWNLLHLEQEVRGFTKEIELLTESFFSKVIPRLLRPLETSGRSISPCFIHGDLWHENVGVDKETGNPVIFDPACFWAHNEYELGVWSQEWNDLSKDNYREEYHKHFPPSEPVEDCDDRNILYGIRVNILDSILYKKERKYRANFIADMRKLINKYPGGFLEWQDAQPAAEEETHAHETHAHEKEGSEWEGFEEDASEEETHVHETHTHETHAHEKETREKESREWEGFEWEGFEEDAAEDDVSEKETCEKETRKKETREEAREREAKEKEAREIKASEARRQVARRRLAKLRAGKV
ncbi:Fructosamine kinase-domain-containing protein [Hypoxylon rubiginosum]|uniref:Fructosamine kinase-domain-containing protein n=1 Tax=Hypoxylon rubiginosum TaxID=110542 RepID=A0ACC0CYF1_9PEZI|nr:Fructosamine kinase-domain-containing protein [Hypoxylon rubiginosum]